MTPAEARLTTLIVSGHSLLAAATELHITKNTARTHMKRIYVKTETHRQVDLVRLLANSAAPPH
jgi:DNA-binding CsgD family transcriptional regulator